MKKFFAPLTLILTLGILPYHDFEQQLQHVIKKYFPSAKDVRVNISVSPFFEVAFGKIDGVDISAVNAELLGLRISEVNIHISNLHFPPMKTFFTRRLRISSFKEGKAQFVITQSDMENFIKKRAGERIKNLHLALKKDKFILNGKVPVAKDFFELSFSLEGKAVVAGGAQIFLEIPRAKLTIIPLPKFLIDFLTDGMNPVFDLREAEKRLPIFKELNDFLGKPVQASLKSLALEDGKIIFEATGIPAKP